jgi:hypothetical protein
MEEIIEFAEWVERAAERLVQSAKSTLRAVKCEQIFNKLRHK